MISWLISEQCAAYAHLTTEALAAGLPQVLLPNLVERRPSTVAHFAAGLSFAGIPAGLAVLRQDGEPVSRPIQLLSIAVAAPLQRLGFARELLSWIRQEAQQLGWGSISVSYPLDHGCTEAMERLTNSDEGWEHGDGLQLLQLNRDGAKQLVQALSPAAQHYQRSGRFELLSWGDLPQSVQAELGPKLAAPSWAWPKDHHGRDPLQSLETTISQVLLDQGAYAGWITAHRVGPRLFRVSQWWVQPRLQGSGAALLLLHRAIEGALQSPHCYAVGSFGMEPENTQAIRLCNNKIAPFASGISRQRRARLTIKQR